MHTWMADFYNKISIFALYVLRDKTEARHRYTCHFCFLPQSNIFNQKLFQVTFDLLTNKFMSSGEVLINKHETFTYLHWLNLINTQLPSMERIMLQLLCHQACSKRNIYIYNRD